MANGSVSDDFADDLLLAWLTKDVSALPDVLYVGLTLELPSDANGTGAVEPEAAEYQREPIPGTAASWAGMGLGSRSAESAVDVCFQGAITDWGEINGYLIYDAATGGRFLGYGITNPYTIRAGMAAMLPAGAIVLTVPI